MVVFRWFLFYWIGVMIGIIWVDLCKGLIYNKIKKFLRCSCANSADFNELPLSATILSYLFWQFSLFSLFSFLMYWLIYSKQTSLPLSIFNTLLCQSIIQQPLYCYYTDHFHDIPIPTLYSDNTYQ